MHTKIRIIACLIALLGAGSASAAVTCTGSAGEVLVNSSTNPETGHYFEVYAANGIDWATANANAAGRSCEGVTGHLATITASGEEAFVDEFRHQSLVLGLPQPQVWVGGFQDTGGWRWINNEGPFPSVNNDTLYANWAPGEPNNSGGEDKVEYFSGGSLGGWNDILGTAVNSGYIVEYPVPAPSTLSGTVTLQDYSGTVAGIPVVIELKQAGVVKASLSTTLNAAGFWTVNTPWVGTFDVFVKPSHWLKKRQGSTSLNNSNRPNLNTSNINGDLNNDNGVDVADYAIMSAAYNLNGTADLDGDAWTDIADYAILSSRYGLDGDD